MKNLPFDTTDTDADDIRALEDIYAALPEKFAVGLPVQIDLHLNEFELFRNYPEASLGGALLIDHPEMGCYLLFVKVPTHIQNGRGPSIKYSKYQIWASATLRNDFGHLLIKRETFVERLLNAIHPVELKFVGDAAFNANFNVMTNDREKTLKAMTPVFRTALKEIELHNFMIEIRNSTLLIGSIDLITAGQTLELARIASHLSTIK